MNTIFYFLVLSFCLAKAGARYRLVDKYTPQGVLDNFVFDEFDDPTHGFVNYVSSEEAQTSGLAAVVGDQLFIRADNQTVVPAGARGRDSVRIHSEKAYNHGLFILDLEHMPTGCGTWPSFWLYGLVDWPRTGEIDVIEGVNTQRFNSMTLHTAANCSISRTGNFSGQVVTADCDVNAANQSANAGCSIQAKDSNSFGRLFNSGSGGVYALEWTSAFIKIWFFRRGAIPANVQSGRPDPSKWPQPAAAFQGDCDLDGHIFDQHLTFDLTFCGDWAGRQWTDDCGQKAATCEEFVRDNPTEFNEAYWLINTLKVFQKA